MRYWSTQIWIAAIAILSSSMIITESGSETVSADDLTPFQPISIEGNEGFNLTNGVSSGSGTKNDPYVIEDLLIVCRKVDTGIIIRNTTVPFVIRNCVITVPSPGINESSMYYIGIKMESVIFGGVQGCKMENIWGTEVLMDGCEQCKITENVFMSDKGQYSVQMISSNKIEVSYNTFDARIDPALKMGTPAIQFHKYNAIQIEDYCSELEIVGNYLTNYKDSGINAYIEHGYGIKIEGNRIVNCDNYGIYAFAEDIRIANNMITECGEGINVHSGKDVEIRDNNCSRNSYGIHLIGDIQGDIAVFGNILVDNNICGMQSNSPGAEIFNNEMSRNGEAGLIIHTWMDKVFANRFQENGEHGVKIEKGPTGRTGDVGYNKIFGNDFIDNGVAFQAMDDDINTPDAVYTGIDRYSDDLYNKDPIPWLTIEYPDGSYIAYAGPVPNWWYHEELGGNYWSGHSSIDGDKDGFLDSNYSIPGGAGSVDENPLAQAVDITLLGPRVAPHIIGDPISNVEVGTEYLDTFTAVDNFIGPFGLEWSLETSADWLTLDQDGILKGTPAESGEFWVNVSVSDGDEFDNINFTLTVFGDGEPNEGNETPNGHGDEGENETIDPLELYQNPPVNLSIDPGSLVYSEGGVIPLTATTTDPDLTRGDVLTYVWEVEGIGIIGYGPSLNYSLPEGTYTVKVTVSDRFGNTLSSSVLIEVRGRNENEQHGYLTLAIIILVTTVLTSLAISLFFFKKRAGHKRFEHDPEPQGSDHRTGSVSSGDPIRTSHPDHLSSLGHASMMPGQILEGQIYNNIHESDINDEIDLMKRYAVIEGPTHNRVLICMKNDLMRLMESGGISKRTYEGIRDTIDDMLEE